MAKESSSGHKMSATIRQAVLASGKSLYRVSKDSGVAYGTLHRFVVSSRPASMDVLDKLCAYLGLKLTRS